MVRNPEEGEHETIDIVFAILADAIGTVNDASGIADSDMSKDPLGDMRGDIKGNMGTPAGGRNPGNTSDIDGVLGGSNAGPTGRIIVMDPGGPRRLPLGNPTGTILGGGLVTSEGRGGASGDADDADCDTPGDNFSNSVCNNCGEIWCFCTNNSIAAAAAASL